MTPWTTKAHRGIYSTNKSRQRTASWLIMRRRLIGSLAAVSIRWILFSRVPAQLLSVNTAIVLLRACSHWGRGPQVGEVTLLGGVTRPSIWSLTLIWPRLHGRWGDPPHITSPIWGPPPPCKQALKYFLIGFSQFQLNTIERRSFIYFLFIVEPNLQFNLKCIKVYPSLGQCIAYLLYAD